MGIHLSSLAQINSIVPGFTGTHYFVYLINYYNIEDDVLCKLLASVPEMNANFSKLGNVVPVTSVKNIDFANRELSWDNCFGTDAAEVCPAVLICTLPPLYFIPSLLTKAEGRENGIEADVPWVLLSLKDRGRNIDDLTKIIHQIVEEFATGADISSFYKIRILHTVDNRPVINAEASGADASLPCQDIFKRLGRDRAPD